MIKSIRQKFAIRPARAFCTILSVACLCFLVQVNNTWADSAPDCASGSCQEASWNYSLGMFENCPHDGDGGGSCWCYQNTPDGWQNIWYDCACTQDADCYEGYCDAGVCIDCIDNGDDCPASSTTTDVDECNQTVTSYSWTCRNGCQTTTTNVCKTGTYTNSVGTYSCMAL